ncbi:hypothetical protein GJ496_006476 [Pomphorhynchus laevis]|nr:hypothetical protein GJ496_006476 [Pomphorhynchus laevis]
MVKADLYVAAAEDTCGGLRVASTSTTRIPFLATRPLLKNTNYIQHEINAYPSVVMIPESDICVQSEIGRLRKVLVHAPDDGIGKIFPLKAQDWLFEDIIDLYGARNNEYKLFVQVLYAFLDSKNLYKFDNLKNLDPKSADFPRSDYCIDIQWLLSDILENETVRAYIVSSICTLESVSYSSFLNLLTLPSRQLANTLISGTLPNDKMLFSPVPNMMMTRDIGVIINDHIMIGKPAKDARKREAVIMKFIVFNHPMFAAYRDKVIDLTDNESFFLMDDERQEDCRVTMEGGDFLMLAPNHLAIGVSERTSMSACKKLMRFLFKNKIVEKVTLIELPTERYCMHLDTVITQISKGMWVVFSPLCGRILKGNQSSFDQAFQKDVDLNIEQFSSKDDVIQCKAFSCLEDFLTDVIRTDLEWKGEIDFIMSGGGKFPDAWREQWTDACNVFAIKPGVILTYDRNRSTIEAFKERGKINVDQLENTVITIPSAELSRARGGSHCMTQPLFRDALV